jgi:O-antigen ligase
VRKIGRQIAALAVAATFAFFPMYASLGLLYTNPRDTTLPPSVWLVPRAVDWVFAIVSAVSFAAVIASAARWRRLPALFWPGCAGTCAFAVPALAGFEPVGGLTYALGFFAWMMAANALLDLRARVAWLRTACLASLLASGTLACALAVVLVALRAPADLYAFHHGRAVGTFLNTNELAGYAVVLCAIAAGCAVSLRGSAMRTLAIVAFVCGLSALVLTFSRSGFIGAVVATLVFLVALRPTWRVALPSAAFVVALLAVALIFDVHHNPAENLSRIPAWTAGWRTFQLFPLTGVGPIAYYRTYPFVRPPDGPPVGTPISYDPHDLFLTLLAETGVAGAALFASMWWRWFVLYRDALRRAPPARRIIPLAIGAGLAGLWAVSTLNTLSIVFAMWANFMALALVTAQDAEDGT